MKTLDKQLAYWKNRFGNDVKIHKNDLDSLATVFLKEITELSPSAKEEIKNSTPVDIELRYEELIAFQAWMDIINNKKAHPAEIRAQIIVTNYLCFVYLNDSCFKILKKYLKAGSTTKKCCNYMINNPVRAFRNAIAHSNWCYKEDFSAILYWAKKGHDPKEPLEKFEVTNEELAFWQTLARGLAYVLYEEII